MDIQTEMAVLLMRQTADRLAEGEAKIVSFAVGDGLNAGLLHSFTTDSKPSTSTLSITIQSVAPAPG